LGSIGKRPRAAALAVPAPSQSMRITTTKRIAATKAIKSVLLMAHFMGILTF